MTKKTIIRIVIELLIICISFFFSLSNVIFKLNLSEGWLVFANIVGFIVSVILILDLTFSLFKHVENLINSLKENIKNISDSTESIINFDRDLKDVIIEHSENEPVKSYIDWISERNKAIISELKVGQLIAQDPNYFTYVNIIFNIAKSSIVSTSVVDPSWYFSMNCKRYIQDQKLIIESGITYTRIFFLNDKYSNEDRINLFKVIDQQVNYGFTIHICLTLDISNEKDVAIIDEIIGMKATIEQINGKPIAEINHTVSYLPINAITNEQIKLIKLYINELLTKRTIKIINNSNYDRDALLSFLLNT